LNVKDKHLGIGQRWIEIYSAGYQPRHGCFAQQFSGGGQQCAVFNRRYSSCQSTGGTKDIKKVLHM